MKLDWRIMAGLLVLAGLGIVASVWSGGDKPAEAPPAEPQSEVAPEPQAPEPIGEAAEAAASEPRRERIELKASNPEELKAAIEHMRQDPEKRMLADELEASLDNYRKMLDSGMDPGEAAEIFQSALADSLTKQYKAKNGGNPQIKIRIQGRPD